MLETLSIRNFVIIESAVIPFKDGLDVLSGETGAGKSIILDAISLILGGRASVDLIRAGAEEALIEGILNLSGADWLKERLERLGYPHDVDQLLIKRTVSRSGRHKIFINGELATIQILTELCDGVIDVCGQHEHQSLVKPAVQLDLVDRYGGLLDKVKEVSQRYSHVRSLRKELEFIRSSQHERLKRGDYLRFQIEELRGANLRTGEEETLQREKQLLQSTEQRLQSCEAARQVLDGSGLEGTEDHSCLHQARRALTWVRSLATLDASPGAQSILASLERAVLELEDVALELNRYGSSIDANPGRLVEVLDRLACIAALRRKYGNTIDEMLAHLADLEGEFQSLDRASSQDSDLDTRLSEETKTLLSMGKKLSTSRSNVARTLSESVTHELQDLRMGEAKFEVQVNSAKALEDWTQGSADTATFLIQPNPGEELKPLSRVASGGELSRVMLAVRRVIADSGRIGVYLFDEIDAGMGGQTAFQVGRKLKSVAAHNQVLCITHLPQVASFADHHLVVRKRVQGKRTLTEVIELGPEPRKEEIARMLGGDEISPKSLANAEELLQQASPAP